MIGVVFATMLAAVGSATGPAIGVLIQSRLNKQIDDTKESLGEAGIFRKFFDFALDWFPWILIVVSIYSLYQELRSDETVTRAVVFRISAWVSAITVNITLLIVEQSITKIWNGMLSMANVMLKHVNLTKQDAENTFEIANIMALEIKGKQDKEHQSKSLK